MRGFLSGVLFAAASAIAMMATHECEVVEVPAVEVVKENCVENDIYKYCS